MACCLIVILNFPTWRLRSLRGNFFPLKTSSSNTQEHTTQGLAFTLPHKCSSHFCTSTPTLQGRYRSFVITRAITTFAFTRMRVYLELFPLLFNSSSSSSSKSCPALQGETSPRVTLVVLVEEVKDYTATSDYHCCCSDSVELAQQQLHTPTADRFG